MRSPLPLPAPITLLLAVLATTSAPGRSAAAAVEDTVAYRAARIWTGDGPPINDAVLVVADGRIAAVGPRAEVEVPETARVVNLGASAVLIPGLIAAESSLGAVSADDERALTPGVRAIDGFDPFADFEGPLSGGVTSAQLSPGLTRLMPGRGAVVKLSGPDPAGRTLDPGGDLRVLLSPEALNPPRIYEPPPRLASRDRPVDPTQPQLASSLAGAVAGLRSLLEAARARDQAGDGTDPLLDPLAEALGETGRLRVTTPGAAEIRAALALAGEFDLKLVLVRPTELRPFLDHLGAWADRVDGVVLDARFRPGRIADLPLPSPDDPRPTEPWEEAAALVDAGLPVAIVPSTDGDLSDLLFLAGQFTAGGLSDEQVLRMITAAPAGLLGVADRVGSLAAGKDADFVVLSGDPFDLHTRVREVYVSGRRAWSADAEAKATVIRAGAVHAGDGSVIESPTIVVQDGKIRGVGPDASAPIDAEIFAFEGAVITPGLIDLATDLGLGGPLSARPQPAAVPIALGPFPIIIAEDEEDDRDAGGPSRTSVSLETKLGDRLVSGDPASAVARRGGITAVLAGPREASPSPVVAFKLGDDPTVLRDPAAIRFQLAGNMTTAVPGLRSNLRRASDYAKSWEKYASDLADYEAKKKDYEEAKARLEAKKKAEEEARKKAEEEARKKAEEEARKKAEEAKKDAADSDETKKEGEEPGPEKTDRPSGEPPPKPEGEPEQKQESTDETKDPKQQEKADPEKPDAKTFAGDSLPEEPKPPKEPNKVDSLEPYRELFAGSIPALVEVDRLDAIRASIELFRDEFKVDTVLLGAADAFRDADLLAGSDVAVVVGPDLIRRIDRETVNLAQVLATRGVPFGFQSQAGSGSATLPRAVRYAVRLGLGTGDALAGLSSSPAAFLKLDDRIGTIAPGKDADLVVWSGPPFEPSSRVLAVMIDGKWVALDQEDGR